ncbi:MAG TPA: hypothetical protein VJQ85_11285, partial [Gaiellaceae bacterium]|nr:hypothetical protein [Gaiellaceae bacterium]
MSAITRGVVAAVLLASAVAGAVAFPRILAGPGEVQTPSFAALPGTSQPAIVRAQPLPPPAPTPGLRLPVAPVVHVAPVAHVVTAKPKPIVVRRVTPPAPVARPKPAPAPTTQPVRVM